MQKLSERALKELQLPAKGRRTLYDSHRDAPRGFGIRLGANGRVAFVLRYLPEGGGDRLLTIGDWPTWSVVAARKRAIEVRREVETGTDVLAERRRQRAQHTLGSAIEEFCQTRTDELASARDVRGALAHVVDRLGKRKLAEVRRREIVGALEDLAQDHGRQARRALTYLKQLYAWAEDRELVPANPVASLQPRAISRAMTAKSRERVLDNDEVRAFWANVEETPMHRLTALALKMILVTGQRPGEVAGMAWTEVDGDTWIVPGSRRGKTETSHAVPLTREAEGILHQAARLSKGSYVFSPRGDRPLSALSLTQAVRRHGPAFGVKEDADGGGWRPHDLRRTMRTGLAAAGVSDTIGELVIGHTRRGIAAVYDRHSYASEKRAALEAWERRLRRIAAGMPADQSAQG